MIRKLNNSRQVWLALLKRDNSNWGSGHVVNHKLFGLYLRVIGRQMKTSNYCTTHIHTPSKLWRLCEIRSLTFFISKWNKQTEQSRQKHLEVLSDRGMIFYQLGWLSPKNIKLKILLLEIWIAKLDLVDNVSRDFVENYLEWRSKLLALREIKLGKFVLKEKQTDLIAMDVFCDASETIFGACIYVVAQDEKVWRRATLLSAKAKVAPL